MDNVDNFVEKLIAILDIFKTREERKKEIENLIVIADSIARKTQEDSLAVAEKLFTLRSLRNKNKITPDKGLSSIFEHEPFNLYEIDIYQGFDYILKNTTPKILDKQQSITNNTELSKPYDYRYYDYVFEEMRKSMPRRRVDLDDEIYG